MGVTLPRPASSFEIPIHKIGEVFQLSGSECAGLIFSGKLKAQLHPMWYHEMMEVVPDPNSTPNGGEALEDLVVALSMRLTDTWRKNYPMNTNLHAVRVGWLNETTGILPKYFEISPPIIPFLFNNRRFKLCRSIRNAIMKTLIVNKKSAIIMLITEGYRPVREVHGISFQFIESVMAEYEGSRISKLEKQLAEAHNQIENLQSENTALELIREKDARIAELEAQLTAAQETQSATTVDAAKWENSVRAVLEIWVEIIQGDKTDWKEGECRVELANRYSDYHTKVHDLAWRLLPGVFKHGRGRPKKKLEKSQQPNNS